jgi:hypothetical protein
VIRAAFYVLSHEEVRGRTAFHQPDSRERPRVEYYTLTPTRLCCPVLRAEAVAQKYAPGRLVGSAPSCGSRLAKDQADERYAPTRSDENQKG